MQSNVRSQNEQPHRMHEGQRSESANKTIFPTPTLPSQTSPTIPHHNTTLVPSDTVTLTQGQETRDSTTEPRSLSTPKDTPASRTRSKTSTVGIQTLPAIPVEYRPRQMPSESNVRVSRKSGRTGKHQRVNSRRDEQS